MIPTSSTKLLVTEDWKKIYQSFRNADFQSYDFETLRRTMIQYLQENYPEDFNDFIESSEYIALIDLIAFLGQNLSFRIDLNARENFIETAQRRDSILRLAQLISYVPSRNVPSNGFLKLTSVSTTDSVVDSNGLNLANVTVGWNDSTNSNWYGQFISILNSAMGGSFSFGKPYDRKTIDGILTEQYRINSANTDVPVYSFLKNINGTAMTFEIVPCTFSGKTFVYEEAPKPGSTFSLIYKNDNQGSGSVNTGFFVHFRQGELTSSNFNIDNPVANEIIGINANNINQTDVWLWKLSADGEYETLWTKVPDVVGNNVIYNSLKNNERDIFSVSTRDQDQIDLNFADGNFGNLPKGSFRLFYRQSNGLTYTIKPEQMNGIVLEVPYVSKAGQNHTLTLTFALQYTINNSASTESNVSIQNKAPQSFYVQNRMVTAEDYNIAPLTLGSDIIKVKSVNRVSSGVSKYFELSDVSGKYSKTNIFASDGMLYKKTSEQTFEFQSNNRNGILGFIKTLVEPVVSSPTLRSFYLDKYSRPNLETLSLTWNAPVLNQAKGYLEDADNVAYSVGTFTSNNLKYFVPGALIKFVPPTNKYFSSTGKIVSNKSNTTKNYIWAKVVHVVGDGSNTGAGVLDDGTGPITLSTYVPTGAIPYEIIPKFINVLSLQFENELVNLCLAQRNFGITFSQVNREWQIILDSNLDLVNPFSLVNQGSLDDSNSDASWLIAFTWTGKNYRVRSRYLDVVFESEQETAFFIDRNSVNYDFVSNTVVKDRITVLSVNEDPITTSSLEKDYIWQVDDNIVEEDGYVDPKKVVVSLYEKNNLGELDDPDAFINIVKPESTGTVVGADNNWQLDKFVYFQKSSDGIRYDLIARDQVLAYSTPDNVPTGTLTNQLYYFYNDSYNVVNSYDGTNWVYEPDYFAYPGRSDLKFHYEHNSSEDRRIDPGKSNLIDIYLLTRSYDTEYRTWLQTGLGSEPLPPTTTSLEQSYTGILEPIKTISDEIVFQPVKYKVLFGKKAPISLQATFKAVKNPARTSSDNEIKSRILTAITDFFNLDNWDFGQPFYFSELSTFVMNLLSPDITNFIIVPRASNFGSLYEVSCLSNEIFINDVSADDIDIIDAITANQLNTTSIVNTSGL